VSLQNQAFKEEAVMSTRKDSVRAGKRSAQVQSLTLESAGLKQQAPHQAAAGARLHNPSSSLKTHSPEQLILSPTTSVSLPSIRSTLIPEKWRNHRQIVGQCYYTIPPQLLDAIKTNVGVSRFDSELWSLDEEFGQITGDHGSCVGFQNEAPIPYSYLREKPLDDMAIKYFRQFSSEKAIQQLSHRLEVTRRDLRAYAGWLSTNPGFLSEHQVVWTELSIQGLTNPIPVPMTPQMKEFLKSHDLDQEESQERQSAVLRLQEFCNRWWLQQLVGPHLPLPLGRAMAPGLLATSAQQAEASGFGILIIPDTMPIPSEAEIRAIMEDTIQARPAKHLEVWHSIIGTSNMLSPVETGGAGRSKMAARGLGKMTEPGSGKA